MLGALLLTKLRGTVLTSCIIAIIHSQSRLPKGNQRLWKRDVQACATFVLFLKKLFLPRAEPGQLAFF